MPGTLDPILRPRSVAVIGASRNPRTIGSQIVANLVNDGFTGPVFPVNPSARAIHALPAWASVGAIPEAPDLAVIVVPKERVQAVAEECVAAGVKGLVVISAGFREVGGEGVERERRLTELVRANGVRMVGPNCLGVLNTDPAYACNATFARVMPPHGRAAFVSQSGAMGLTVLDYARSYGIGIAQFVSVGNKSDVSGNDLVGYWEHDDAVDVILMYVESFGNPRKFLEVASRVVRRKPIVLVKSGRSRAGARAASSHTGALAASDAAVDALLIQAGVIRAESVEELFDYAMTFTGQPAPRSRRTAVVSNSGGAGILAADALDAEGLELPDLSPATVERLRKLLPPEASLRNPLDMIASAGPEAYGAGLDAMLADPNVDAALAMFVPPLGVRQEDVAAAIARVVPAHAGKPVLAVLMGNEGLPEGRQALNEVKVPAYIFPESAARALAALAWWGERRERTRTPAPEPAIDRAGAAAILEAARAAKRDRLDEAAALGLMEAYGIPVASGRLARSAAEAASLAVELGFPVALKVMAPTLSHKSDVGGVRLGLPDGEAVRRAHGEMLAVVGRAAPGAAIEGVLVQRMAPKGLEVIVGVSREPAFGPLVMFGLGGVFVEVLKDVAFRLAPLAVEDAHDLLGAIRGAKALDGVRGGPAVNRPALVELLLRVSRLALDFPAITSLDLNPVMAGADGVVVADARVVLGGER
ncbi:MAG TPA: acetate--CoA ligase family protein [Gemmatimonadales bacterium]|nr:acetate--CoA ligase family protein [Gemmatimonadales bacterium]